MFTSMYAIDISFYRLKYGLAFNFYHLVEQYFGYKMVNYCIRHVEIQDIQNFLK